MTRTAIAVLQPVWDCRWSRPGQRLTGISDARQPESRWVCERDGQRRNLRDAECETCPRWELGDEPAMVPVPMFRPGPIFESLE